VNNSIVTSKGLPTAISFEVKYPGHVDLILGPDYKSVDEFIVLTAQAADELCQQLKAAVEQAYRMAEQQPLFKEAE
jgi:hypothetical protein